MRVLGVDFGQKRIGLAISDDSALIARPWQVLAGGTTPVESAAAIAHVVETAGDLGPIAEIVVGLPRKLNGDDTDQTPHARALAAALRERTGLAVHMQDERLTSHEADARLAERERAWRRRKALLDAASAAVILQDYLDERGRMTGAAE
jgi:putative Holliday junction resolvase